MVKGKTKYQVIIDLPEYDELEASAFLCMLMTEHRILKERIKLNGITELDWEGCDVQNGE